jgi:hypothetical protein
MGIALPALYLLLIVGGLNVMQTIGLALATVLGLRFVAIGWWFAHLVRLIDPISKVPVMLRITTLLVAVAQVAYLILLPYPAHIVSCSAAVLILALAGWAAHLYGEAGEIIEPPPRDPRDRDHG